MERFSLGLLSVFVAGTVNLALTVPGTAHAATSVPAGFEALMLGQNEKIEVVLFATSLGLYDAEVKPETLRFSDPAALTQQLIDAGYVKPLFKRALIQALHYPLPRNGHLACDAMGCGFVKTDAVAVIFDESRSALDLFINPQWLMQKNQEARYYSAASNSQNALIHHQTVNWSKTQQDVNVSARGVGALGLGANRYLAGNWNAYFARASEQTRQQFRLQDLYLRQDWGKSHYIQAGQMDQTALASRLGGSFNFTLLPMPIFRGLRVGTTQAWRNQHHVADNATPVTLLLNHRARVDLYRGAELLGSQYMMPGLQAVETRNLPGGSYPLQLRIYQNDTLVRTEEVAFSKAATASASDKPEWFAQVGQPVQHLAQSSHDGRSSWQVGVRARVLRSMQVTSGLSATAGGFFNETRLDWQTTLGRSTLSASASVLLGERGVSGNAQQITINNGVSLSLYRSEQRGAQCRGRRQSDGLSCGESVSATLSTQVKGWTATLGHTRSTQYPFSLPFDAHQTGYSPRLTERRKTVSTTTQLSMGRGFTYGNMLINGQMGVFRSHQQENHGRSDRGVFLGMTLSHVARPPSSATRNSQTNLNAQYRSSALSGPQTTWNLSHDESFKGSSLRAWQANLSGSDRRDLSASLGGRVDGRYGNLNATLSHSQFTQSAAQQSFTGSYDSTLIASRDGMWLGAAGYGTPSGAALVRVAGKPGVVPGAAVDVQGNGQTVTLGLGDSAALPLPGWQQSSTDIHESDRADGPLLASISHGSGNKTDFIQPGRLVTREVSAKVTYTLVGRALADGKPLRQGTALNAHGDSLNQEGAFVLETPTPLQQLYIVQQNRFYTCALPAPDAAATLQVSGEIHCHEITLAALPAEIQNGHALAFITGK
ncbi:TcfC E-set like domain-containing protein [Pantoea eucrina]|uniref:TcfC E-set like domain-containing protein n=1 Tax=Pantoea eucrina TaxID=472693 RepID=A0ABU5LIJ6_9GAMM|nr:TcfC E-set like domain-containing protein [Pantoea eucrina]MDZ7279765.1 TcfC E-set like domain-containing protein [Pantoea eucrina]